MSILRSIQIRTENLIKGSLKEKLVFVHVPKCGGNSIAAAIHDRYKTFSTGGNRGLVNINAAASLRAAKSYFGSEPFENDYSDVLRYRELLLGYFLNLADTKLVSGHICFSKLYYEEFKSQYAFITILRDPVKRWISAFFYNKYRDESDWKIEGDVREYLKTNRAISNGYEYVKKFLGTIDSNIDYTSKRAIEKAKHNLDNFALVGRLENLEEFSKKFKNRFGTELQIGKKNTGPKSSDFIRSKITEELEEQIRELCKPDLAIYQHAIENY